MEEAAEFSGLNRRKRINFTHAAWERIFEEYIPYSPAELDYKGFVNLILALENPTSPASIKYFWKVLDFDRSGFLTPTKIKFFYNDVYQSLVGNYDAPSAAHVVVEVFDILACNNDRGATLDDFLTSKQGHVVVSMLLDVNGFWRYDNRESLVGTEDEDDSQEAPAPLQLAGVEGGCGEGGESAADALDALLLGDPGGGPGGGGGGAGSAGSGGGGSSSSWNGRGSGRGNPVVGSVIMDDELDELEDPEELQIIAGDPHHSNGLFQSNGSQDRSQFTENAKEDSAYNDDSFEQYDDEFLSEEDV